MSKCEELFENVFPKSVYQLRESFFDKLRAFDMEMEASAMLLSKFAVFDFESICVKNCKLADTEIKFWVR